MSVGLTHSDSVSRTRSASVAPTKALEQNSFRARFRNEIVSHIFMLAIAL